MSARYWELSQQLFRHIYLGFDANKRDAVTESLLLPLTPDSTDQYPWTRAVYDLVANALSRHGGFA